MENVSAFVYLYIVLVLFVYLYIVLVLFIQIWSLLEYFLFRPNKTSYILKALFKHFNVRNEQPVEFRILESKAKQNTRVFEVKTIRQKYYTVVIKKLKVLSTEPIDGFSIPEEESYIRGVIDPVYLNSFNISYKDPN